MRAWTLVTVITAAGVGCKGNGNAVDGREDGGVIALGDIPLMSGAQDIAIAGDTAYALGVQEFFVTDLSDPTAPEVTASANWGGLALHLDGTTAYVASGARLRIADLEGVFRTEFADFTFSERPATRVAVTEDRAYLASQSDVLVLDLTLGEDATALIGSLGVGGAVQDVKVWGNLVLAAASEAGLVVVDVSGYPPATQFFQLETQGDAVAVFTMPNERALVAATGGITIFDLQVLTKPVRHGRTFMSGHIYYADTERAYVLGEACPGMETSPGFHVIDITDEDRLHEVACGPVPFGTIDSIRSGPIGAHGFVVSGSLAALAVDDEIVLLSVPTTPPRDVDGGGEETRRDGGSKKQPDDGGAGGFVDAS